MMVHSGKFPDWSYGDILVAKNGSSLMEFWEFGESEIPGTFSGEMFGCWEGNTLDVSCVWSIDKFEKDNLFKQSLIDKYQEWCDAKSFP